MSRGSRIVDLYNTVQNVEQFYIALNGVVNSVAEGYIAETGVIRQFWPPTLADQNAIILTTEEELSYATRNVGEGEVRALCSYEANTGRLILSDKDTVRYIDCLAPAPRGAGSYLIRITEISGGLTLEFPSGEWHDVFEYGNLGVFDNYLLNGFAVQSVLYGEAEVSVAEDDGAGAPVGGTIVTKTVQFTAEVVGNNLSMTTVPWILTDIQYNNPASVILLTVPAGVGLANEAFITGNEHAIEVIREIYAVEWGIQFRVKVDVVSGSVTGADTGSWLSTFLINRWEVSAPNPGDDNSAVVDVSITDGVATVTKRVYMTATQNTENTDPGSDLSDDWTRYNLLSDNRGILSNGPYIASVTLLISPNGTINSTGYNDGQNTDFPQNWNDLAPSVPDPQNFECRLTIPWPGDSVYPGSSPVGVWINLSNQYVWTYYLELVNLPPPSVIEQILGDWTLEVREVGRPDTVKTKLMRVLAYIIGPNNGEVPP